MVFKGLADPIPLWYERRMTLKDYLSKRDISQAAFAALIGKTQATVNRYVQGERFPDKKTILRIEEVTDGSVRPADWFRQPVSEAAE